MKFPLVTALAFLPFLAGAQSQYRFTADIRNVTDDAVTVTLLPPAVKGEQAVFSFAKAIPGSYARKDFGRFIDGFQAFNKQGKAIVPEKLNENQYRLSNLQGISKITYRVNDTWDDVHPNFIFQPGGSNIDAGKNFVINGHAFFGYFEGYTQLPIEVNVVKPADLYGSTHLSVTRKDSCLDVLKAKNYFGLADNPVIYARADTTSFSVGKSKISIAVYSADGKISSQVIAGYLQPMSDALDKFFNGLPVDSYQFLFYFDNPKTALTDREKGQGGYGALEHNYSSLYYLPEIPPGQQLQSIVTEVASHEFLHILTPLNLHSEQIEKFDFSQPKMSRHLWLYEGVTEYFAHLVQLQNGLISQKQFFKTMREKIGQAEEYGDFSMTDMSLNVMDDEVQQKYNSVYNRGALIGFMLDVEIREKTQGRKDLKSVILELSKKYGPNRPFKDEALLPELVKATDPALGSFIARYITGSEALPYAEFFAKLGYEYRPVKKVPAYYAGEVSLRYDAGALAFVFTDVKANSLGVKNDDLFIKVNAVPVTPDNVKELWDNYFQSNTTDPELTLTLKRKGEEKVLSCKLSPGYITVKNYLAPSPIRTEEQDAVLRTISNQVFVGLSGY